MKNTISQRDKGFINMACKLASDNIDNAGGPFAAVIVKKRKPIKLNINTHFIY